MHVTKLEIENWKGETASEPLSRLTAWVGPTGSGKTARLKALMYAFVGHAGDGKRNEDVAEYVGAKGGGVDVTLSDGFSFSRSLVPREGTGWTELIDIAGEKSKGVNIARGELRSRFGDCSQAVNPEEIVAMKPEDARDFLLDLCQSQGAYDATTICRLILLELLYEHESCGEGTAQVFFERFDVTAETCTIDQVLALAEARLSERENEAFLEIKAILVRDLSAETNGASEQISNALDSVADYTKVAKAEEKKGRAAVEELTVTKNATPAVPGEIDALTGKVTAMRTKQTELSSRIAAQKQADEHTATLKSRLSSIGTDIEYQRLIAASVLDVADKSALESQRDSLAREADELVSKLAATHKQLGSLRKLRDDAIAERNELTLTQRDRANLIERRDDLDRQIAETKAIIGDEKRSADDLLAEAEKIEHGPDSPLSAAKAAVTAAIDKLAEAQASRRKIEADVESARRDYQSADLEAVRLGQRIATAQASPLIQIRDVVCECCREKIDPFVVEEASKLSEWEKQLAAGVELVKQLDEKYVGLRNGLVQADSLIESLAIERQKCIDAVAKVQRDSEAALARASELRSTADWMQKLTARETARANIQAQIDTTPSTAVDTSIEALAAKIGGLDGAIVTVEAEEKTFRDQVETLKSVMANTATKIQSIESEAEAHHKRQSYAADMVTKLEAEKAETEKRLADVIANSPNLTIVAMENELASVKTDTAAAEERLAKKRAYLDLERNLNETLARAEARGTAHLIGSMAVDAVKEVRESLLKKLTAPLTTLMTEFLDRYEPGIEAFLDLSKSTTGAGTIFRLGWIRNGRRVGIKTVAGGERVALTAALAYAVTKLKDPPLRLLLIDACTASRETLFKLIPALAAVSDDFGNVCLGVHPIVDADRLRDHGWSVHTLISTRAESAATAAA